MKNIKKKTMGIIVALGIVSATFTGCFAGWGNDVALHGGAFSNSKGTYVILNESGGQIMDCWILRDSYVKSEKQSDGLNFVDKNGNGVMVQGDSKVTRINNSSELDKYIEYHLETDLIPYSQFYKEKKGQSK